VSRFLLNCLSLGVVGVTLPIFAFPIASPHAQQAAAANAQPAGNVENGRRSFTTYACSACHGYSGQGGVGPRLATTPLSIEALMKYVRQPTRSMPRYATETQISDATLTDIYAFLKSIPPPPDPKTIPLLQGN
jgi:mono/diheme cytochrome c family protein